MLKSARLIADRTLRTLLKKSRPTHVNTLAASLKALAAISAMSLVVLSGVTACGSSASPKHESAGTVRIVHWGINRQLGKRTVRIAAAVPYCGYDRPKPRVQRIRKVERPGRAVITMFVFFPRVGKGGCTDVELGVMKTVRLKRPLSKISLYDGSVTPPRKRWPRG